MSADAATIVVVDDAPEVRVLLRTSLKRSPQLRMVGEGADGAEAIALAEEHQPSLMLLDVSMPGMDGLEALPRVLAASPRTRVVLYSGFEEQGLVDKARQLGAAAFIEKSTPVETVLDRLLAVRHQDLPQDRSAGRHVAEPVGTGEAPGSASVGQGVLVEHLERFREVFEEASIGMATMTLTGHLVRVNRALAALMQRSTNDLVGAYYGHLTDGREEQLDVALEEIRQRPVDVVHLQHGVTGATDHRRVRATLAPVRDAGGRALYLFLQVQDVTAEHAALAELRRSEERFRLLVEAVKDYAIFMLDPDGNIASWNAGAERSNGYTVEEAVGRHFRILYPPEAQSRKHPEHELEVALRDGQYEEEGWRVRKDGTRFWATVVITAVHNAKGRHIGFAKVTRDTSERRRLEEDREQALGALGAANTELESLNQRLQQAAHDQAQFLAVTAHELRTPIAVLGGSAEALSQHWDEFTEAERNELFESMTTSTGRLRRLLTDLLTASRLQASALELRTGRVLVKDVVVDAIAMVRRSQPDAEIIVDGPTDVAVTGDRDRLSQALDNLLSNALRHGAPPVRVRVDGDAATVQIRVSDQGAGVSEAMRDRLFERFATGRRKGGTGLGLFIVRELARAHGGDASYEPVDQDTPSGAFVISLPSAPPPQQPQRS